MESTTSTREYTIILPEPLLAKIRDFQEYISYAFNSKLEFDEIMTLLLRYTIKDFDKINDHHLAILKSYFAQKQDLLDDIYLNTIRSSHIASNLCTV
ncbi:MAG: hypothetical protein ACE5RJ_03935 [Nitrosopumilaceae archaeon]